MVVWQAFSTGGELLATLGLDSHHQIGIYDWRANVLKIAMVSGPERPLDLQFTAEDDGFVVCGVNFVRFHKVRDSGQCAGVRTRARVRVAIACMKVCVR